jgi:hypothetical protein
MFPTPVSSTRLTEFVLLQAYDPQKSNFTLTTSIYIRWTGKKGSLTEFLQSYEFFRSKKG